MLSEMKMNGWRKRIGFISPSIIETTIHDFMRFAPPGIGHVGITSNIETWGKDHFEGALTRLVQDATSLATRKVDYIIYAGVPLLVARGKGADLELIAAIRQATGLPATTSIRSVIEAFNHLGMRRIVIASPYPDEVQRDTIAFLRAHDFEVIKEASMRVGFRVLQDVHPQTIYQFGRDMLAAAPEADGLYMPCHQWQAQEVVEALEHDTGKPVIAGDPADWWAAFRALGICDRIEGCGRLLRSLSDDGPAGARGDGILRQAS
jgi:maleate cis-trans isomerase